MCYLCSLSKAFDAVYHHILLEKLKFYGLQQYEVNWLRSYQCSKKQQVYVNSLFNLIFILSYLFWHTSKFHTRIFSFLVCNSTPYFCSRLYADKTSLAASGSNLDILLNDINSPLHAVYKWLCSNKLTLSKTNYIIFFFTLAKEK